LGSRFAAASTEAESAFGDGRLYLERFIERARHVEVQILADGFGTVVHLGDRDCSLQRRYQKVLEEAPAAAVPGELRQRLADAAVTLARELSYVGAGTVEFLVDLGRADFSFLELNTRVQVEHPVTEAVTGVDIVREQLRIAAGKALSFRQEDIAIAGHAIECRINAETPSAGFLPSPGRIKIWSPPTGADVRVDTHVFEGYEVPPFYDSLLAKLIVLGPDRETAIRNMETALDAFRIEGVDTTLDVHRAVVSHPDFRVDHVDTQWFERVLLARAEIRSAT
jgi:acetyl-CoA carboxylase biotin carboxylase subunit